MKTPINNHRAQFSGKVTWAVLFATALAALVAVFVYPFARAAETPIAPATVATDYPDYLPGDVVHITGTGFIPGETVTLVVRHILADAETDPITYLLNHDAWTVVADPSGGIIAAWLVTTDCLGATLELKATGMTSGQVATTTFTDGDLKVAATPSGNPKFEFNVKVTPCDVNGVPITTGMAFPVDNTGNKSITISSNLGYTLIEADPTVTPTSGPALSFVQWSAHSSLGMRDIVPANPRIKIITNSTVGANTNLTANYGASQSSTTTAISAPGITYGANGLVTVNVTSAGGTPTGTVSLTVTPPGGAPYILGPSALSGGSFVFTLPKPVAGTHALSASYTPTGSFSASSDSGKSLVVAQKPLTITASSASKTYGATVTFVGNEFTTAAGQLVSGDSVSSVTLSSSGAAATANVGSYPIVASNATGTGLANYAIGYVDGSLTVTKRDATVTANSKSKTYGDANPVLDAVVTGTVNGDVLAYTLATTADQFSGVGSYPITMTLGSNPNYNVTPTDGTLTVTTRNASVTANSKSKIYGDANPVLDAVVTGTVNGDMLAYTLATTAAQFSGVGSYPITVTLGSNPNYNVTPTDGTLTVTTRNASVTANSKSKIYGEANPVLDGVVTGAVNGDMLAYTLATTAAQFSGVGSYPITVTLGSNPNYNVTPTDGTLTVTTRNASVTANSKSKTYGDANPVLDSVVTGTVNGDVLAYTLATTAAQFSGVGSYPITVTLGSNPNYNVSLTNGTLAVAQRNATVTANSKSKIYGEVNPEFDAIVTGTVNGNVLAFSLGTTATQFNNVGSYAITVTLGSNPNYSVALTHGTLTVTPAIATVVADSKSRMYGLANPLLTAVVNGQVVGGDAINYSLSTTATSTSLVGTYPITVSFGSNPNYSITPTDATLTITPAPLAVTINSPLSGHVQSIAQGVAFNGTFTLTGNVGTYTAKWTFTSVMTPLPVVVQQSGLVGPTTSGTQAFTVPGVYAITLTVTDGAGTSTSTSIVANDSNAPAYIVVYDPSGSFVTGGGWIDSPAGADQPLGELPSPLAGRANFGFVSKYKKGANIPEGNTEFQFQAAGLNFKSTVYQWLVVAGTRAQFKGDGTINGQPGYGFMLTAIDGDAKKASDPDRFRIKIWHQVSGQTVYDNQVGASDDAPLGSNTVLRGGSIVVH